MRYFGEPAKSLGIIKSPVDEMMFYQYLPIKFTGGLSIRRALEKRLLPYTGLIYRSCDDYIQTFGMNKFTQQNIYLTVKNLYQSKGKPFNRDGWHSDGYLSDDINYIWSDSDPTIVNVSEFKLSQCHHKSIEEMTEQAYESNSYQLDENELVRLDQYTIHKIAETTKSGLRNFFKLSFSTDRYNLKGNAFNSLLPHDWDMIDRQVFRNHPTVK